MRAPTNRNSALAHRPGGKELRLHRLPGEALHRLVAAPRLVADRTELDQIQWQHLDHAQPVEAAEDYNGAFRFAPLCGEAETSALPDHVRQPDFQSIVLMTDGGAKLERFSAVRGTLRRSMTCDLAGRAFCILPRAVGDLVSVSSPATGVGCANARVARVRPRPAGDTARFRARIWPVACLSRYCQATHRSPTVIFPGCEDSDECQEAGGSESVSISVLGEALIDFIVGDDGAYRPHLGGSPFNVAIGLARQGVPVSYLSAFSDDAFGDRLRGALAAEGVSLPLDRRSLWPTSLALVTIDEDGLPTYRLYREGIADKDTSFEEIADNLPDDVEIFHTGSLAITPSQLPKIRRLFGLLRERGVLISIDINIRLRASIDTDAYLAGVRGLLSEADIVKASDEDIDAFGSGADTRSTAETLFGEMSDDGVLVLTEGRGGAVLWTRRGTLEKHAYPIAKVEDTVGAGDTFHAAFLASLCGHGDPAELLAEADEGILGSALDFACAAAAINVSRKGCSPPTADEVRRFIAAAQR